MSLATLGARPGSVEDGVAALNVGLDVAIAKVSEEFAEVGHGQFAGGSDIDGAE